ncbi:MAG: chromate efflux transporter [Gammaproteobacteria bacterium]|nr:chromate efflux transporter [Gammaproteobacteria bacterium]
MASEPASVPFAEAVKFWLKLGFISFGGPAGQIAIMHQELVDRRRWISESRFLQALNYCMVLPGPEAQQLATYLGWLMHRTLGGLVAGILFVLPSFLLLVVFGWIYLTQGDQPLVAGIFGLIKPAVTAVVLHAAWRIGQRALKGAWPWALAVVSFLSLSFFSVPFPLIILFAGLIGWLSHRSGSTAFTSAPSHARGRAVEGEALINQSTPVPEHARFSRRRLVTSVVAGVALWLVSFGGLLMIFGSSHPLIDMGRFFTQAALLTFGGAYAVLPYVFQGAVETYGWVTPAQMIDGLALGESTPGPLIMVITFVAFVGAFAGQFIEGASPLLNGVVAASVATWFTFLPSFVFILAGGPLIESGRHVNALNAPLAAITAAVVGIIANLAVWFGLHVFFPAGVTGVPDLLAVAIALAAAVALFAFKRSVIEVIGAVALLGATSAIGLLF